MKIKLTDVATASVADPYHVDTDPDLKNSLRIRTELRIQGYDTDPNPQHWLPQPGSSEPSKKRPAPQHYNNVHIGKRHFIP